MFMLGFIDLKTSCFFLFPYVFLNLINQSHSLTYTLMRSLRYLTRSLRISYEVFTAPPPLKLIYGDYT